MPCAPFGFGPAQQSSYTRPPRGGKWTPGQGTPAALPGLRRFLSLARRCEAEAPGAGWRPPRSGPAPFHSPRLPVNLGSALSRWWIINRIQRRAASAQLATGTTDCAPLRRRGQLSPRNLLPHLASFWAVARPSCQAVQFFRTGVLARKALVNLPFAPLEAFCPKRSYSWFITCPWTQRSEAVRCLLASIPVATAACRYGVRSPAGLMKRAHFISLTVASKLFMSGD